MGTKSIGQQTAYMHVRLLSSTEKDVAELMGKAKVPERSGYDEGARWRRCRRSPGETIREIVGGSNPKTKKGTKGEYIV